MLLPKAFYFFFYAAGAALVPYLVLHYRQMGLSGGQIGLLAGISPLITLISAPLWGALADLTQRHKAVLMVAIGGVWSAVFALSAATSFAQIIPIIMAYAFCGAPIIALVDNSVLALLGAHKDQYGKQRLWGAIGWGVAGPIMGWVIEQAGLRWIFAGYLLCMFCVLLVASRLVVSRSHIGTRFGSGLQRLLANRQWVVFLVTVFCAAMGLSLSNNFLFLHLSDLGASKTLMGMALLFGTLSEIPVLFFADRLLRRWGSRGLLIFAMIAYAARAFAYSFMRVPWLVLPIQLLHGPSFSAMWVAGVSYAHEIAPEGMGATAQGVFSAVTMGLGAACGAFLGGWLYETVGGAIMFLWMGVIATMGLTFFILAHNYSGIPRSNC